MILVPDYPSSPCLFVGACVDCSCFLSDIGLLRWYGGGIGHHWMVVTFAVRKTAVIVFIAQWLMVRCVGKAVLWVRLW